MPPAKYILSMNLLEYKFAQIIQMQSTEVREQMFQHIRAWELGDISQKEFCERANIRYHVFHYWYKVYRDKDKAISSPFVKLKVDPPVSLSSVELICPDGKRLLFHQLVPVDYLKALIS